MFPLHLAALSGFSDCCRKLLSSGEQEFEFKVNILDIFDVQVLKYQFERLLVTFYSV